MNSSSPVGPLEVYLLGLVNFEDAQLLQRRLLYELGERPGGALIVCEHPPIISVGRAGSRAHIRADDEELRSWGIPVRWVNRGGGCVLHTPGQLTVYLILPLDRMRLDVCSYLDGLQRVVLGILDEFDLSTTAMPLTDGVNLGSERVASIGVAVRRWTAYYGLTLNVGPFLAPFGVLSDQGPNGRLLHHTSMEARRQRPAPMSRVRESLIRRVETIFRLERSILFTTHSAIRSQIPQTTLAVGCH